jgi:hypothetical protein
MKTTKPQIVKYLIFLLCILFITIDLLDTAQSAYDIFRIFIYGMAINLITDYLIKTGKRGKR